MTQTAPVLAPVANKRPPPPVTGLAKDDARKRQKLSPARSLEGTTAVLSQVIQLQARDGEPVGGALDVPSQVSRPQLQKLLNGLLGHEDPQPYTFFVNDAEVEGTLADVVASQGLSTEKVIPVVYVPQAVFRVMPCTREVASLPGHTEAILVIRFSPDSKYIATGSGDTTVRIWETATNTPKHTLHGHHGWVQSLAWSPTGEVLASGCMEGELILWRPDSGKATVKTISAHRKAILSIAWEPYHLNPNCTQLATSSKDGTIKVWDAKTRVGRPLNGHKDSVNCLRWGEYLYSCSRDRTIKVWDTATGRCIRTCKGHGHWVNHIALNTDYALSTPLFRLPDHATATLTEKVAFARKRYDEAKKGTTELLVSASDDFTLFLYAPTVGPKPVCRMTGHQQLVNHVCFSPDGTKIASASFDKSVRVWNGRTGKFLATMRGHVQAVYQVHWSADSRLLVSGSKDATVKIWSSKRHKMAKELPGHADEVFATAWSPDGRSVASGGRDRLLKVWN